MKSKRFLSASFIIAVLLVGAILLPSALMKPYSGDSDYYAIAHESTDAYAEYQNYTTHRGEGNIAVENLSESQQRAFKEAKNQEPSSSGSRSLGRPPVCTPTLLVCDEYETFPHPVTEGSTAHGYVSIENSTGDEFIVQIGEAGPTWDGIEQMIISVTKLAVLGPYALFLGYRKWTARSPDPTFFSIGYGATLLMTVFAYPYVLMFTEISLPSWHLPFLAIVTWGVILAEIWWGRNKNQSYL